MANCWEFMNCGREQGGENASTDGPCPAWPDHGHCCAAVAGTLCGGQIQGVFAQKLENCLECNFYKSPNNDPEAVYELVNANPDSFQAGF